MYKKFRLTPAHYKIMLVLKELNAINRYATPKGVNNILKGEDDIETLQYKNFESYMTLISFPSRKFSSYINNLVRRGYLSYIHDKKTDGLYLYLTSKGEIALDEYLIKHKAELIKKKNRTRKAEIVML